MASPVHKQLDKSILSGDFQSCNVLPDSGGNTNEKRNMKSHGESREHKATPNLHDSYKDKPYMDQAKEVSDLSKLKQKRFNSTDVNKSDN